MVFIENIQTVEDTSKPVKDRQIVEEKTDVVLKCCPFCGSEMKIGRLQLFGEYGLIHVEQNDCVWMDTDNEYSENVYDSAEIAAEKWNRRV